MLASLHAGGAAGIDVEIRCDACVKSKRGSCGVVVSDGSEPSVGYDLFSAIFAYGKLFDEVLSNHFSVHRYD